MICFRDMTFCSATCMNDKCNRQFTPELKRRAEEWWRPVEGPPPVAFSDFSSTCEMYIGDDK